jgi:arylsulfatase A-like enzyme
VADEAPEPKWSSAPMTRPNVVFIMADDLGYADLSCYGQRSFETPELDRLASGGLQLTHGYANSAVCSPTRVALLTGRYQQRLPVGLPEPGGGSGLFVPEDHPTLANLFKAQGYETCLVGKWHLGNFPDHSPRSNGYDHYFSFQGGANDYFRHSGQNKVVGDGLWLDDQPVERRGYLTDLLADYAVDYIGSMQPNQPFLMSLHFNAPHWPWEGPGDEALAATITNRRHTDGGNLSKYGEIVRAMDSAIGRVLGALRQRAMERDTIVVFTSDNGGERFSDTWPFNGRKSELLEGGIRVPAIIRWPAAIEPGTTSSQVVTSMDWLPTLLEAAGGQAPESYEFDGENLLPVLTNQESERPRKLFWRYRSSCQSAVRDGDLKYPQIEGKEFLFNVVVDPQERANLKDLLPDEFARLKADHAAWEATMLPYPENSPSETPKSLGYYVDRY